VLKRENCIPQKGTNAMAKFITNWSIGVLTNAIWAVAGFFIGRALQMEAYGVSMSFL
jgi:hypothetical protein